MTEKEPLYITIFGKTVPAEWLRDEPAAGVVRIGVTLPIARPALLDRHVSTLKSYSVPFPPAKKA